MKTLVLLSGGVDSTVVLAEMLNDGYDCSAVTFQYGQTHAREVDAAIVVADHYEVDHSVLELPQIFGSSALLGDQDIPEGHADSPDATVVPARNLVLLSFAAALADAQGAGAVAFGANLDDAAGYPDCRPKFIESLRDSIIMGTQHHVWLCAPFLYLPKQRIVQRGRELGVPFELTWSCYRGGEQPCGRCGACVVRQEAMA